MSAQAISPRRTSAPPAGDTPAAPLEHKQIVRILTGLMLGMFLASLDQTIVSTAIRTISDDLNGYSQQAWVTTAYLITSTIATPIYGRLSDIYGRKPFFLAAIFIFLIGSAACSFSTSMYMLAIFRALQGVGAGGLMSLALAIIGDIVPPRERAKYQGYFLAVFGTSSVLGPIIGGAFAGADKILWITGWRWVFLVNVPIGLLAAGVVMRTLHLHHVRREAKIDWFGAATLVVCLVPLLIIAEQGREWGWHGHRAIWCYAIGAVGLVAFLVAERFAGDNALIPLRIFRNRSIAVALLGGFVVGMGMFGAMMLLPQYLQVVHGASPTKAGYMMLPMVLGMMIASIASGQLTMRTGKIKIFPIIGVTLMVIGYLLLWRVTADTRLWVFMSYMFIVGLGLGNTMQPLTLSVQAAARPGEIGMATSAATFFRQIGGTLGVAIFLSVLFTKMPDKMQSALSDAARTTEFQKALHDRTIMASPDNQAFGHALATHSSSYFGQVMNNTSMLTRMDAIFAHPFRVGFTQAMNIVFIMGAIICAVGVLILLFLPNVTLGHRAAGQDAAGQGADEEGAAQQRMVRDGAAVADGETEDEAVVTYQDGEEVGDGHALEPVAAGATAANLRASSQGSSEARSDEHQDADAGVGLSGLGIYGTVRQATERPVVGAHVTVTDRSGKELGHVDSDENGHYRLPLGNGGTFLLIVSAPTASPQAFIATVGQQATQYDITLEGKLGVTGHVRATAPGTAPRGLSNAVLTLTDVTGAVVGSTTSGADGSYALTGLVPGQYVLTAQSGQMLPQAQMLDLQDSLTVDLLLSMGSRVAGVVSAAMGGQPLPNSNVSLLDASGQVVGQALTSESGEYRFNNIPAGAYTLVASGYEPVAQAVTVTDEADSQVSVQLGTSAVHGRHEALHEEARLRAVGEQE